VRQTPSRYLQAAIVWWRRTLVRGSSLAESKWSARFVSRSEGAVATKLFLDGVFADEGLRESYRSPAFLFSLGGAGCAGTDSWGNRFASRQLACGRSAANLSRCGIDRRRRTDILPGEIELQTSTMLAGTSPNRSLTFYLARSRWFLSWNCSTRRDDPEGGSAELLAPMRPGRSRTVEICKRPRKRLRSRR